MKEEVKLVCTWQPALCTLFPMRFVLEHMSSTNLMVKRTDLPLPFCLIHRFYKNKAGISPTAHKADTHNMMWTKAIQRGIQNEGQESRIIKSCSHWDQANWVSSWSICLMLSSFLTSIKPRNRWNKPHMHKTTRWKDIEALARLPSMWLSEFLVDFLHAELVPYLY